MGSQRLKFKSKESLVEVIHRLEHLVASFKKGQLCIRGNDESITLKPQEPIALKMEAEARLAKDSLRERLIIELKWRKDSDADGKRRRKTTPQPPHVASRRPNLK